MRPPAQNPDECILEGLGLEVLQKIIKNDQNSAVTFDQSPPENGSLTVSTDSAIQTQIVCDRLHVTAIIYGAIP